MNLKELARKAISTLFLSMLCLVAFAQGRQVNGTVKDAAGEPMIGVNVLVKGTTNGTITDFDGNFSLSGVKDNDVLSVTYIGYITQEVKVGNQKTINVVLKEDTETLDEVVVIGYGTVKKRDLTGSVASVSNEALVANPVADVSQALQGKLAGVSVVSQDGRPGASVSIRVRGGGSISQSNDPLFIVDGFPVSSISDIPADQIVSIDVLKDASSTAIYGARGANGVILVTTKGADKDRVSVSYSGYYQSKWAAKTPEPMSAQDYVKHTWGYGTALGMGDQMASYFGLGEKYGNHYSEYANMDSHNWTDDMLRTASAQNHNVTINGGSEKTKISFSVNYLNDDGIKIKSGYERFSTNLKLKQELAKGLSFELDARYVSTNVEGKDEARSGRGSLLSSAYQYRPIDTPLGNGDDALFQMGSKNIEVGANPVGLTNAITDLTNRQNIRANAALNWEIIKGLKARTEFAIGHGWSEGKYYDDGSASSADNFTRGYKYAKLTKGNTENWRSVTTVNYEVQGLGDNHNLSFLLGNEVIKNTGASSEMIGAGYSMAESWDMDRVFGMFNMYQAGHADNSYSNKINTPSTTVSFFGRGNYSLKGRYLLTATLRADGSSKFGPNHRWGYFPAGAFAWRISDEPFFQPLARVVDNLKLRASYGVLGNQNIGVYPYQQIYELGHDYPFGNPATLQSGAYMKTYNNPEITWEKTAITDIGLDFSLLNGRFSGTLDYFYKYTSDILAPVEVSSIMGREVGQSNVGAVSNEGIEINLTYNGQIGRDFRFSISPNFTWVKNAVEKLANGATEEINNNRIVGQPIGIIYGYETDGLFVDQAEIDAAPEQLVSKSGLKPGYVKYKDISGPDGVPDGKVDAQYDRTVLGSTTPKFYYGLNLSASYKGFDFSALLQGLGGHKRLIGSYMAYAFYNGGQIQRWQAESCWKEENPDKWAEYPRLETLNMNDTNLQTSDYWVRNASFLRVKNIQIGYTFPKAWTKKIGLENVRVYVSGQNLFSFNSFYKGWDPENEIGTGDSPSYYPVNSIYSFGFNFKF